MIDYWSPESTCAKLKPAREDDTERSFKSGTGKAGKDGYTAGPRRVIGDLPGEMSSREDADRRENPEPNPYGYPASEYDD